MARTIALLQEEVTQLRAALEQIKLRREDWDKADAEHPFDIVTSFWKAIEIAEAALGEEPT